MIGTISIADLEIRCIVGILERERKEEQTVFVDIEMDRDFAKARSSESVAHTVDYAEVARVITELAQFKKYWLIETLAEDSCKLIFDRWPEVKRARVTVKKPDAVPAARHTAVSVERRPPEE